MAVTRTLMLVLDSHGKARALRGPAWDLRAIKGPGKGAGRAFEGGAEAVIGHEEGAELQLNDDSVSALHGKVVSGLDGFRVRDLGSKNGIWLEGRRVQEAWLSHDDTFTVGRTVLRFRVLGEGAERSLPEAEGFGQLVGQSWRMRELYGQLARAAASDASVLLEGETGTGKELAFEALVSEGARREQPMEVVDCASLSPSLAEAELFGYEPGAFTGASAARAGAFERAHRGTLLLDQVGELPQALQPRLLGVLERKSVQRLGGSRRIPLDVRTVAATHRSLEAEVNRGGFRADLFYRLSAIHLQLPPLRERREDIPLLIAAFLSELPGARPLPPDVLEGLTQRQYAGNVRELRNVVERYALGLDAPGADSGPTSPGPTVDLQTPYRVQKERVLEAFERAYLSRLLEATAGNVSEAARRSGIHRVHLHQMLKKRPKS